jgi:hypothetical protein
MVVDCPKITQSGGSAGRDDSAVLTGAGAKDTCIVRSKFRLSFLGEVGRVTLLQLTRQRGSHLLQPLSAAASATSLEVIYHFFFYLAAARGRERNGGRQ